MKNESNLVLGILAHVDAGKTTLSEAMLYLAGKLKKLGRVDHRDSFLDTHALERQRGITIFSKQAVLPLGEGSLTLLDTPGHVDFSAEAERTLRVLDCAVLVISGTDGVQAHTETLWKLLERYHVPTFLFVTKMDLPGHGRDALIQELNARLSEHCIDFERTMIEINRILKPGGINHFRVPHFRGSFTAWHLHRYQFSTVTCTLICLKIPYQFGGKQLFEMVSMKVGFIYVRPLLRKILTFLANIAPGKWDWLGLPIDEIECVCRKPLA